MADTKVVKSGQEVPATRAEQAVALPDSGPPVLPDVDIIENRDGIRLIADLPGVDQQSVEVTVESNVLTIKGQAQTEEPAGYSLAGREYVVGNYRRDFTFTSAIDPDRITARFERGVLEVTMPKRAEARTRTIKVGS